MDFLKTIAVAASGLKAQSGRMRIIAENLANADSTASQPGVDPYRRRVPTFVEKLDRELGVRTVALGRVVEDQSEFRTRFDPGHPAADEEGQVQLPNVSSLVESMDMREAQRSYEANLNLVNATRRMLSRTIDILRA
ncbi:flagellar basal body rod protein FlgC [Salinarimonas sp.]|uniref:flagellar basal body rod protein FlgC n=1 Tax=Salinarimonas sp. TaxID=2766526 RepID=UPI0032D912F5